MQKRVLTIQDFSCLGRCSLTVAIPTLSAAGLETVAIPTAILSNHTAFASWTYKDLTEEMLPIVSKWKAYKDHFDYIYTGYLGTDQIEIVLKIVEGLKKDDTLLVVDPAMADHGKLYPGFKENHVEEMRKLVGKADILLPNLTEACFLADIPFPGGEASVPLPFYERVFKALAPLGPSKIVITGQALHDGKVADLSYDVEAEKIGVYETKTHSGVFHGTGDLFASAFVGALGCDFSFEDAIKIAHDYVHKAIGFSNESHIDGLLYGPEFERAIPSYIRDLKLSKK